MEGQWKRFDWDFSLGWGSLCRSINTFLVYECDLVCYDVCGCVLMVGS